MRAALKKLDWTNLPILAAFALSVMLAPVFRAQDIGSITKVTPVPDGATFTVDGASFQHAVSNVWPNGSKHVIGVPTASQVPGGAVKALYTLQQIEFNGGALVTNPLTITATPTIPEYRVIFNVQYALSLVFFNCPDTTHCASPGTILVNGAPVNSSTDLFFAQGSAVILQALPNAGYVFAGWKPAANQQITGFQNIVTLTAPTEVYPIFQVARKVNFETIPDGLQILADRAPIVAPTSLDWGWDSVHTVGPVSPQQDKFTKYWVFKSWSDGGAANHAYTVAQSNLPTTLTATYVPAAPVTILTQPLGLKIKVDGVFGNILNPYFYTWGVGETHHVEAPLQQTDAQGRVWQFSAWSNGGTAVQDVTVPDNGDVIGGMRLTATYTPLTKLTVESSLVALSLKVDGSACVTPCEVLRAPGSQVKVTVPTSVSQGENARADFNGWPTGGTDFTVTLGDANQSLTAAYHMMNRLNATTDPPDGAVVTVTPVSADGFYDTSATVAVSLSAQPGYKFRRWDGDLTGSIPSGLIAMTAPRYVRGMLDPVPYVAPSGVINAAGVTPQKGVAPGSMISIFGANLAKGVAVAGDGMLPQSLGGLIARASDRLLPLIFTSPAQINAQLPDDMEPGTQIMTISPAGEADVRATFTIVRNAPGLFPVRANDQAFAMAVHEDGSAITSDSPAKRGELITVYGTGFGPADHPRPLGFPTPTSPEYLIVDNATVQVGELAINAEKAFVVPGRQGVDAVQFRLGDGAPTGTNATFKVTVNGVDSNTVLLSVE